MKLALGTAQFGLKYGTFNEAGQVSLHSASGIMKLAADSGIQLIDTAYAYGESESVLGNLNAADNFKIVTKVPALNSRISPRASIMSCVEESLSRLGVERLYGLLLHRIEDLLGTDGDAAWKVLEELRTSGLVERIGFSAYGTEDALDLLNRYSVSLIQAPFNVFDTRHRDDGVFKRCNEMKTEVHVRSVFLQGFALSTPEKLPEHLRRWRPLLSAFKRRCEALQLTPLQAALGFVLDCDEVDQLVVGVETEAQLSEIVTAAQSALLPPGVFDDLTCCDLGLIDPSTWP